MGAHVRIPGTWLHKGRSVEFSSIRKLAMGVGGSLITVIFLFPHNMKQKQASKMEDSSPNMSLTLYVHGLNRHFKGRDYRIDIEHRTIYI